MKICEQLLLKVLLLTVIVSSWVLVSALISKGLLQRSSSSFKGFSFRCYVVGSSLIWKKKEKAEMVTRCHSLSLVVPFVFIPCHSFSFVVTRCTTRCHSLSFVVISWITRYHSLSLDVPLVCLFINDLFFSIVSFIKKLLLFYGNNVNQLL